MRLILDLGACDLLGDGRDSRLGVQNAGEATFDPTPGRPGCTTVTLTYVVHASHEVDSSVAEAHCGDFRSCKILCGGRC